MTDYAEKECVACGRLETANLMVCVTEEAKVGRSSGRWSAGGSSGRSSRSSGGHTSYGTSSRSSHSYTSGQDFYETQRNWYCSACDHARRLTIAARRRTTLIGGSVVIAVIAAAIAALFMAEQSAPQADLAQPLVTEAPQADLAVSDMTAADEPIEPFAAEPVAPSDEAPPTSMVPASGANGVPEDSAQYRALLVSLQTGEPARWSDGASEGSVSVSDLTAYPDRSCRSFQYRTRDQGETQTLAPQVACQAPGGPWRVQP